MTWRIRDRTTFVHLRQQGVRRRSGAVMVTAVLRADPTPPRLAFAVGRRVGGAVVRNRVRRRLRSAATELARDAGPLASGAYLVSAAPEADASSYAALREHLREALVKVNGLSTEPRS